MTTGISGTSNEAVSRGKAAQLAERALDIELMDGENDTWKSLEGKTILTEYWNK